MPDILKVFSVETKGDGYPVTLISNPRKQWLVHTDRSCSCNEKKCQHVKAVAAYVSRGGKRVADLIDAPAPLPIKTEPVKPKPKTCPICGTATLPDHRFDSIRHGSGWRCPGEIGLFHMFMDRYLEALKWFYSPDYEVTPGIRRRDLNHTGDIGYLPESNRYR